MTRSAQIAVAAAVVIAVGLVAVFVARRPAASVTGQPESAQPALIHLGAAVADTSYNWCAAFDTPDHVASEGDPMTLIWSDSSASRASVTARVRAVRYGMCYRPGIDSATNADAGQRGEVVYDLTLDDTVKLADAPRLAHVVVGASTWGIGANGWAHGDIDGDGTAEFVRECTSSEGLHLTLWRQRSGVGLQRIAHYYHYLGYDVVPSCTSAETRDQ